MVIKTNPTEVWARQGLVHNVDCWLQMIDKIHIERSLGKRKKIKGFPTCISRLEWSCKGSDPTNMLLQPQKDEISYAIKKTLAIIP
jgi:hypothetical protein